MIEIIKDTLIDSIKLLPFLFITYLIMEYIENKTSNKVKEKIKKSGKFGPLIGGIVRNFTSMWVFSISYKFIFIKINFSWNIDSSILINLR
mgnify:FL=1